MQSQVDTQTIDTQGIEESLPDSKPKTNEEVWACLIPDSSNYKFVEIRATTFSVGRHGCTFDITADQCGEETLKFISKQQCVITVVLESEDVVHFKLTNVGTNPMFVNGVKVPKGTTILLGHDDTVCFGRPKWKAWKFSCNRDRLVTHPDEVSSKYIVTGELGSGAHGIVYKAYNKMTSDPVALKVIKLTKVSKTGFMKEKDMVNEINVMKKVTHPNVVSILDIISSPMSRSVYLAMEYIQGGDLFCRLQQGRMTEDTAKFITFQIANAVRYLHSVHITHRDIKPENILLESDSPEPVAKLTDFGLSKYAPQDLTALKTFCGTMNYVAPEILKSKGKKKYSPQVDVWSLGVVLYVCLVGYPPFSEDYQGETLHDQILKGNLHISPRYWCKVSSEAQGLVRSMLTVDPAKRIPINGAVSVLRHPWFTKDKSLANKYNLLMDSNSCEQPRVVPFLEQQATASVSSDDSGPTTAHSTRSATKRRNEEEKENEDCKRVKVHFVTL